jgi:hypothetical protein
MKIKTAEVLKNLNGEPMSDGEESLTLGHALGALLGNAKTGGAMKLYVLATEIYKSKKDYEVDKADLSLIKQTVDQIEGITPMLKGQILLHLDIKE